MVMAKFNRADDGWRDEVLVNMAESLDAIAGSLRLIASKLPDVRPVQPTYRMNGKRMKARADVSGVTMRSD